MTSSPIPFIPEGAPFTCEQRAWLNGFLAGLFSQMPVPQSNGRPPQTGEPLLVLFGSQTGTAESLAKQFAKESERRGFAPSVLPLNDFEKTNFAAARKTVIISSTWGDGDPPDNAANFWNWLKADFAPRLENMQFAVLGLGDRNYSDFCGASKKIDLRLESLGAIRLLPRGECDVDYESTARNWMDGLWEKLANPVAGSRPSVAAVNGHQAMAAGHKQLAAGKSDFSKSNPFPARLLKNLLLNKSGSAKEVRHFEISLADSGLNYEVGDALGVMPVNCPVLVGELLAALKCRGDESARVVEMEMSLREALLRHLDITKPSRELLVAVAKTLPASQLAPLLAPDRAADLRQWLYGRDVLDIIRLAPTPEDLRYEILNLESPVPMLRKLAPRLYSISSSPKAHPSEAHLTVSAVRYESFGRNRKGVASTFLADRAGDVEVVKVFVQPSHGFKLPPSGDTPIVMVGPGTGIAPFRAFLEEREVVGAKGRNWLLFGGQKRMTDFLYEEQLTAWHSSGFLTRLDIAFSRDQAEKVYVQHRILENAAELWSWLESGAHCYVCGDASRMAKDVDAALHKIVEIAGGKSAADASAYVEKMKSDGRYQRDVY